MAKDLPDNLVDLLSQWNGHQFPSVGDPDGIRPAGDDDGGNEPPDDYDEYPLLPLRDQVVFPHVVSPLFIGRDQSIKAVEAAYAQNRPIVVVALSPDARAADDHMAGAQSLSLDNLYRVGTEVEIGRVLRLPDGTTSALVQGRRRLAIDELVQNEPYLIVKATPLAETATRKTSVEALMRAVLALFERCAQLSRTISEEAYVFAINITDPGQLADMVASSLDLKLEERQEILEEIDPEARLKQLSILLARELDVLELEERIHSLVQQEVDRGQREYFLREQMRIIQSELGEADVYTEEINKLKERILESEIPEETRDKALHELDRLGAMPPLSPETGIIRTYLDWLLDLPWSEMTEDNLDIQRAETILESSHYGLTKIKERVLEHIAVRRLTTRQLEADPSSEHKPRSPVLCFVGPPGTGKTSIGKSIAQALGRNFVRVSLGGVRDEAEIRGHRRTYIGALPGRIIQTMRQAKTANPVFMLDEIDKLGADFRGDPSAALLEALDPEQNHAFSDHYLEVPFDLSRVMFITTANILGPIPPALHDRMEVIEFSGYIEEEKIEIARRFLIPRQLGEHGLATLDIIFSDGAIQTIIREYTYEAGVRNLEREIAQVCRKLARQAAEDKPLPRHITSRSLHHYLGPPTFDYWKGQPRDEVGVATGVAWTEAGGDLMPIEVVLMEGKGTLTLTGQLGDVMQESAQAAMSYARSYLSAGSEIGIAEESDQLDFEKIDVHIHVPEGAIPKDGPSAGITIATALISALTGSPIRRDVAMTGEITLRGRVLAIGGLKEKAMCAHRAGIKTFLLPKRNEKNLVDIPRKVRRDMSFVFVEQMDQVLEHALLPADSSHPADGQDTSRPPPANEHARQSAQRSLKQRGGPK
jgi:ATP-dependent Lon protease